MIDWLFALLLGVALTQNAAGPPSDTVAKPAAAGPSILDRMAFAVEGAESSHGRDKLMWQPNPSGPQGPMQVTYAATLDVGGGNRFDAAENRQIGRAYLAGMFRRYGDWTDAVAAYNWGSGNLDRWIAAGRPDGWVPASVQVYIQRIMREYLSDKAADATLPIAAAPTTLPAEPPPLVIKDATLHRAFERNVALIKRLRDFLDGDGATAGEIAVAMTSISGRPGYAEFKTPRSASGPALRAIAHVLLGKLQSENTAIALVDERRQGKLR